MLSPCGMGLWHECCVVGKVIGSQDLYLQTCVTRKMRTEMDLVRFGNLCAAYLGAVEYARLLSQMNEGPLMLHMVYLVV